jgi:hypothetical protein
MFETSLDDDVGQAHYYRGYEENSEVPGAIDLPG